MLENKRRKSLIFYLLSYCLKRWSKMEHLPHKARNFRWWSKHRFNLTTILKSIEIHRKVNYILMIENTFIFLIMIPRTHPDYRILNSSLFQSIGPSGLDSGMASSDFIKTNEKSCVFVCPTQFTWDNMQLEKHQSPEQRCFQCLPSPGCSQNNERNLVLLSLPCYLC